MSKCWYCNNELTSENNPKHFGICNKCYDTMFKSGDIIIRSLTNKLKQQLAEKDEEIERLKMAFKDMRCLKNRAIKSLKDTVNELRERLADQRHEICEKIREFVELNKEDVGLIYVCEIYEFLKKIEKGE